MTLAEALLKFCAEVNGVGSASRRTLFSVSPVLSPCPSIGTGSLKCVA